MKLTLTTLIFFIITACGIPDKERTTDGNSNEYGLVCIDGVEYLKVTDGISYNGQGYMAPHFNRDGSLFLCN